MAEDALASTIVGIAGAGVKLSIALYTFSETVATASSEIKIIARDVSLTSSVLEELGANLQQDENAKLHSGSAVQTATEVMMECEAVFSEIESVLVKATESVAKRWPKRGGKVALSALDRLKWPFLQPKMALLRANLERLKSTLMLMLNVLTYAKDSKEKKEDSNSHYDLYQRTLLENLVLANQKATRNYETLLKNIGPSSELAGGDEDKSRQPFDLESQAGAAASARALISEASNPESELEWTIRDSVKRIERTLLQYERSGPRSISTPRMTVQIDLEKEFRRSRGPSPWVVLSIARTDQNRERLPTYNESWIPSEREMFGSLAAGAFESLAIDEDEEEQYRSRSRSRSRSRVRFQQANAPYDDYRYAAPGPSRRSEALQAEIDEKRRLISDSLEEMSRRGERIDSVSYDSDPLASGAVQFKKGARTKTWYSSVTSVWDSLPSPQTAMNQIQKSVKTSGLFFGMDDESENPDTVLEYKAGGRASHRPSSIEVGIGKKPMRSPTFDEFLHSPTSPTTRFTPASSTKDDAAQLSEKLVEADAVAPQVQTAKVEIVAPTPDKAAAEQKIPFLVPPEDEGKDTASVASVSPSPSPDPNAEASQGLLSAEEKQDEKSDPATAAAEEKKAEHEAGEEQLQQTSSKDKGKGKARAEGPGEQQGQQPDEIDRLLKEWTTVHEQ